MIDHTHRVIEATWRAECAKLVAAVTRLTRDVGLAEECAQDALVTALEHWPRSGLPDNPAAWLMTAAKHRALDHLRRHQVAERSHEAIGSDLAAQEAHVVPNFADALIDAMDSHDLGDDLLRLMFIACHPVLPSEARVALTLRLLGGLTTAEIARAFLVPEATIAQRIVRAKKTLADKQVPFELPRGEDLGERLEAVLAVLYLVFNEGYSATAGDDLMRPALCDEALRLTRVLAGLLSDDSAALPEVLGLLALMELQASRSAARTDAAGQPVLLNDQDRSRWDAAAIERGLATLSRADALLARQQAVPGAYVLQAAIAACHAQALRAQDTDWARIAALYGLLARVAPSPVVSLNRAVAVGMAEGPAAGLALADALAHEPRLQGYPYLPAVRADLLVRLGRLAEAAAAFERAASLTQNQPERALLLARAARYTHIKRGDEDDKRGD